MAESMEKDVPGGRILLYRGDPPYEEVEASDYAKGERWDYIGHSCTHAYGVIYGLVRTVALVNVCRLMKGEPQNIPPSVDLVIRDPEGITHHSGIGRSDGFTVLEKSPRVLTTTIATPWGSPATNLQVSRPTKESRKGCAPSRMVSPSRQIRGGVPSVSSPTRIRARYASRVWR